MHMPISTPLTALLGIKHPILLAPMDVIAGRTPHRRGQCRRRLWQFWAAAMATGPGWSRRPQSSHNPRRRLALASLRGASPSDPNSWISRSMPGPRAIMLSFGDPKPFAPRIKTAGSLLICQVQNEDMARQALDAGADILIAQGFGSRRPRRVAHHHRHRTGRSSISRPGACRS